MQFAAGYDESASRPRRNFLRRCRVLRLMGTVRLSLPKAVLTSATKDDALNFDMPRETRGEGRDALLDATSAPPAPSLDGLNAVPTSADPAKPAFRQRVKPAPFDAPAAGNPQRRRWQAARIFVTTLTVTASLITIRDQLSRDRRFSPIVDHCAISEALPPRIAVRFRRQQERQEFSKISHPMHLRC